MKILIPLAMMASLFSQSLFAQTAVEDQHQLFIMEGTVNESKIVDIETAINAWFQGADLSGQSDIVAWNDNTEGLTHDTVDLSLWDKVDAPDTNSGNLVVDYDAGNLTGTWTSANGELVEFYTVKAGNQFALWYVEGGTNNAEWSTEGLVVGNGNQPAISNLAILDSGTQTAPFNGSVFSLGLVGVALSLYRRKSRA